MAKADLVFELPAPSGKMTTHDDFRNTIESRGVFEIGFMQRGVKTSFCAELTANSNVREKAHAVLDAYLDACGLKENDSPVKISIMNTLNRSN